MDDSKTVAPLRKALSLLDGQLGKLSEVAHKQKLDWEDTLSQIKTIRQQRSGVIATIRLLGGVIEDKANASLDQELVDEMTSLLASQPLSLKELRQAVESRGLRASAVRKALNGIAFTRTRDGKYTLRSLVYGA